MLQLLSTADEKAVYVLKRLVKIVDGIDEIHDFLSANGYTVPKQIRSEYYKNFSKFDVLAIEENFNEKSKVALGSRLLSNAHGVEIIGYQPRTTDTPVDLKLSFKSRINLANTTRSSLLNELSSTRHTQDQIIDSKEKLTAQLENIGYSEIGVSRGGLWYCTELSNEFGLLLNFTNPINFDAENIPISIEMKVFIGVIEADASNTALDSANAIGFEPSQLIFGFNGYKTPQSTLELSHGLHAHLKLLQAVANLLRRVLS